MVLSLFQLVAESNSLLKGAVLLELLSVTVAFSKLIPLITEFGDGSTPPDMWFGIQSEKLYGYLETIGPEGRALYIELNNWDFFPYMPS